MSGKFDKKKKNRKKKSSNALLWILLIVCVIVLTAAIGFIITMESRDAGEEQPDVTQTETAEQTETTASVDDTEATSAPQEETPDKVQVDDVELVDYDLGEGLQITDVGKYTGIYMEDGTDEVVSGVMMIVLANNSEDPLQYAEIELTVGEETAYFSVSTLPAGASVVLLEKNRMDYDANVTVNQAVAKNVAFFSQPLSLCENKITIQALNGAMNITNISGEDITDDVVIYYKNSAQDVFYGGITYRIRIEGGMKADEIKQIMASHFSASGSTIMFVTCG